MGRRSKKWEEIPICSFETIAERTKSANKRRSKPPQRFNEEFEYFPKIVIKKEKMSDWSVRSEVNEDGLPMKRRRGRPRTVKIEVKAPLKREISPEISDQSLSPNQSNHFGNGSLHVSTSTPKSVASNHFVRDEVRKPMIRPIISLLSSPPKLIPMSDSETQEVDELNGEEPPTLQPIEQMAKNTVPPKKRFLRNGDNESDRRLKSYNLSENKFNAFNGINSKDCESIRLKKALNDLQKKFELVRDELNRQTVVNHSNKEEIARLRAECTRLEREDKRQRTEIYGLKQKLMEESNLHERDMKSIKAKHWCIVCFQEAVYYCCWLGSYCSQKCQNIHWPNHKDNCRRQQSNSDQNSDQKSEQRSQSERQSHPRKQNLNITQ